MYGILVDASGNTVEEIDILMCNQQRDIVSAYVSLVTEQERERKTLGESTVSTVTRPRARFRNRR